MKTAIWHGSLVGHYFLQYVKARMAYRADLWAGLVSDLASQGANLVFILVVYTHVPVIEGWSREELIFVYGYFLVPFSLFMTTAASLWVFADRYIVKGEMDRILTRPLNGLFQILLENLEAESLLGVFTGAALMAWAGGRLGLVWHWWDYLLMIGLVLGSTLIYLGLYVMLASAAFWTDSRTGLIPLMMNLNNYGRYPTNIYDGWLRFLLTWVLPLAYTAFYPATYLMGRGGWEGFALATPVVGSVVFALGLVVWRAGLYRYRGAGW